MTYQKFLLSLVNETNSIREERDNLVDTMKSAIEQELPSDKVLTMRVHASIIGAIVKSLEESTSMSLPVPTVIVYGPSGKQHLYDLYRRLQNHDDAHMAILNEYIGVRVINIMCKLLGFTPLKERYTLQDAIDDAVSHQKQEENE